MMWAICHDHGGTPAGAHGTIPIKINKSSLSQYTRLFPCVVPALEQSCECVCVRVRVCVCVISASSSEEEDDKALVAAAIEKEQSYNSISSSNNIRITFNVM